MKKVYYFWVIVEEQKGFALGSTKMGFMRLRNEYTLTIIGGDFLREYLLVQISLSEWMCWSVRCTERSRRNALLYCSPAIGR